MLDENDKLLLKKAIMTFSNLKTHFINFLTYGLIFLTLYYFYSWIITDKMLNIQEIFPLLEKNIVLLIPIVFFGSFSIFLPLLIIKTKDYTFKSLIIFIANLFEKYLSIVQTGFGLIIIYILFLNPQVCPFMIILLFYFIIHFISSLLTSYK